MPCEIVGQKLQYFAGLARAGRHRGASSGEKGCREIAKALLDHCGRLDGDAIEGVKAFIQIATEQPEIGREVLDLWEGDDTNECESCRGLGHFDEDGNPSSYRNNRKCGDCRGTGKSH